MEEPSIKELKDEIHTLKIEKKKELKERILILETLPNKEETSLVLP